MIIFWRTTHIIATATFAFKSLSYSSLGARKCFASFDGSSTTASRAMGKYRQLWLSIFHHISPSVICKEYKSASKWHQLLFTLFVKPKKKTAPCYYQENYNPMHPLCVRYMNQKSESERAKNPSDNKLHLNHPLVILSQAFYLRLMILLTTAVKNRRTNII